MNAKYSNTTIEWMKMTIRAYDNKENGFGVSREVWKEVRGRGWYKTVRGWLSLTPKGRQEIPEFLKNNLENEILHILRTDVHEGAVE